MLLQARIKGRFALFFATQILHLTQLPDSALSDCSNYFITLVAILPKDLFCQINSYMGPANKQKTALILFIKNPELGKVKTRLAKDVGDENALKIYASLLEHTRQVALEVPTDRLLYYSSWIDEQDAWDPATFIKKVQSGEDLGARMKHAFAEAFQTYDRVVIIGSDCAQLNEQIIEHALEQLEHYSFVIGPSEDGGYYLLGMQTYTPAVFEEIPWSTEEVLLFTLDRIRALEVSYYLLPKLSDIDYLEDWKKHGWPIEGVQW